MSKKKLQKNPENRIFLKIALKIPIIPYMGIRFSAILDYRADIYNCTQETIVYRLSMSNHDFGAYLKIL